VVIRDIIQGTIDSIHEAIDEADKTASVKRIERVLGVIDPKILEAEVITDLEDLRSAIADYRGITRAGLTPEEYQDEKETAFDAITEAVNGLDIDEDALESLEAQPVKTKREQIMEFDHAHPLNELKRMAREKGVSPSGTKHAIIARLI
jgi:hypothetical protein